MILSFVKRALLGALITAGVSDGLCLAQGSAAGTRLPEKKWPDVSGEVIDGALDLSRPKIEAIARYMMAQQEAMKAGDMEQGQKIGEAAMSNLVNVVSPSRPLPYATVSLFAGNPRAVRVRQWNTTADADGKFEFFDVPNGVYRIVAQDTRQGTNGCPSAELTIEHYRNHARVRPVVYPQTVTLTGRVTDSLGHPVTNVTIEAQHGHETFVETEGDFTRAYHKTSALTDSEGRYELKRLIPAGVWEASGLKGGGYGSAYAWYTLKISAPGYLPAQAFVPVVPEETRQAAETFRSLLVSQATPHEKASHHQTQPVAQPPCQGHKLSGVDFVLYKPVRVEGIFVNKDGLPQSGRRVDLWPTNDVRWSSSQAFSENPPWASSDHEGKFRFDSVAPGAYKVQAYEGNRLVSGNSPLVVTVREGEPVSGLRLVNDALPCGTIRGVVTDAETGKPVKGVTIYAVNKETRTGTYIPVRCLCGNGSYHTSECEQWAVRAIQTNDFSVSTLRGGGISPSMNELTVKAPGYADELVRVNVTAAGVSEQDVKLWRSRTIRIRPVIKKGARVDYYASLPEKPPLVHYVAIPEAGGRSVEGGKPIVSVGCDELTGLKPGRYTLRGDIRYLPGHVQRCETVPLEITSTQTNEVALAFSGGCEIKLELAFAPGTAIWVSLETADTPPNQEPEQNRGLRARAYFREPGSYLLPDLSPGRYRLSLFRMKVPAGRGSEKIGAPAQVSEVTLAEGAATQTLKYEL
jgi:protocatechuate 3,4-dioxygenase beta subunit